MRIIFTIICSVLFVFLNDVTANNTVYLKISPLRGESLVTRLPNPGRIETIFKDGFEEKGYIVLTEDSTNKDDYSTEDMLFCDVFVFQYPTQAPIVSMVVRNKDGVVFYALENIVNFMDRQKANEDVAKRLIRKIPSVPKDGTYFIAMDNVDELFPDTGSSYIGFVGLIGASTKAVSNYHSKNYIVDFALEDKESLTFLYGESLEQFLIKNLVNYSGFRRKVKKEKIELTVEVDRFGQAKLIDYKFSNKISKRYYKRIFDVVKGIPLWKNNEGETVRAKIVLGNK